MGANSRIAWTHHTFNPWTVGDSAPPRPWVIDNGAWRSLPIVGDLDIDGDVDLRDFQRLQQRGAD